VPSRQLESPAGTRMGQAQIWMLAMRKKGECLLEILDPNHSEAVTHRPYVYNDLSIAGLCKSVLSAGELGSFPSSRGFESDIGLVPRFRTPNPISSAATPSICQFAGSGGSSVTIYQSYCAVSLSHLDCILVVHCILPGQTPCELHSHALRSCYEEYLSKCLGSFEALSIHLVT